VPEAPWVEESTWMRISLLLIYGLYRARIYTVLVSMVVASHFYIAVIPTIYNELATQPYLHSALNIASVIYYKFQDRSFR
jgi:hypothetical protein